MKELSVQATAKNLPQVLEFVDANLEALGCSPTDQFQIDVAVEEVFVNIASYAYSPEEGPAAVRFETSQDPSSVIVRFVDWGAPYDPLARPDPDIRRPLRERPRGGLGVFVTRQYMDGVDYQYRDGQNILPLTKRL